MRRAPMSDKVSLVQRKELRAEDRAVDRAALRLLHQVGLTAATSTIASLDREAEASGPSSEPLTTTRQALERRLVSPRQQGG
jgi:hypothetical protein